LDNIIFIISLIKKCIIVMLFITVLSVDATQKNPQDMVYVGGTLIDGISDKAIENAVVITSGNRILSVGSTEDTPIPENATGKSDAYSLQVRGSVMRCISLSM